MRRNLLNPSVVLADLEHCGEHVAPGFGVEQGLVGEHAAVPANVLEFAGGLAFAVAEPIPGVAGNVEFAVDVVGKAVASGLVMGSGAFDGGVVLGDVEVHRPRAQCLGHLFHGGVKTLGFPAEMARDDAVGLGGVVPEHVKKGVRHVGLETEQIRLPDRFKELEHVFP